MRENNAIGQKQKIYNTATNCKTAKITYCTLYAPIYKKRNVCYLKYIVYNIVK